MADDSVKTIHATFSTREAAEIAIERLVQEYGIDRADIFVQPADAENTAGSEPSGGDVSEREGERSPFGAPLHGSVQVSADVSGDEIANAEAALRDAGASDVETR
ncbi:hypothetical protein [Fodinicurvata sp. EGI_FJ10296]|uniref:hypothetical protein n=1 Tax=Fodinicurvata sp. EGI_FJ10296 TaxID=3231908 RepID=UPI003451C9E9